MNILWVSKDLIIMRTYLRPNWLLDKIDSAFGGELDCLFLGNVSSDLTVPRWTFPAALANQVVMFDKCWPKMWKHLLIGRRIKESKQNIVPKKPRQFKYPSLRGRTILFCFKFFIMAVVAFVFFTCDIRKLCLKILKSLMMTVSLPIKTWGKQVSGDFGHLRF